MKFSTFLIVSNLVCTAAIADDAFVQCEIASAEATGGNFTQGVRHFLADGVSASFNVRQNTMVLRYKWAGQTTPGPASTYQMDQILNHGILYKRQRSGVHENQNEVASDDEVIVPFDLSGFVHFERIWMCYENGCGLHHQTIKGTCDGGIAVDAETY